MNSKVRCHSKRILGFSLLSRPKTLACCIEIELVGGGQTSLKDTATQHKFSRTFCHELQDNRLRCEQLLLRLFRLWNLNALQTEDDSLHTTVIGRRKKPPISDG